MTPEQTRKFWGKVHHEGPNDCWPWRGAKNASGHGRVKVNGVLALAHRMAYALTNGAIPGSHKFSYHGTVIMHTCDNPQCCNPAHLRAGSQRDNVQDMVTKGRSRIVTVPNVCHPVVNDPAGRGVTL